MSAYQFGDPSYVRIVDPLTAENAADWDGFVDGSDAHWLWDRSEWARYQEAYGGRWGPGQLHRDGTGRVVTIVPAWPRNDQGSNLIVRLGDEGVMRGRLSKGHRADITRGAKLLGLVVDVEGARFADYQELHAAAFGNVRSPETFAIMREIVAAGRGMLLIATSNAVPVGAALFFRYKRKAYYASAPRRPGSGGLPIGHFLVWNAMTRLAALGYTELDMGPPTAGRPSIDAFKRHFGAEFPPEVEGTPYRAWMEWL